MYIFNVFYLLEKRRILANRWFTRILPAPQEGLEPTTLRLTAECSAIELLRQKVDVTPPYLESGGDLLFRAVSSQVPSALKGLTSVFGMGTGGTLSPLPPEIVYLSISHLDNCTSERRLCVSYVSLSLMTFVSVSLKSSPRPISISKLPCYHAYTADLSPGSLPGVLLY